MPLTSETVRNTPLSGEELRKIILKDVESVLQRDGLLQHHLAYGRVAYEVTVKLHLPNPMMPEHNVRVRSRNPAVNMTKEDPRRHIEEPPLSKKYAKDSVVVGSERAREIESPNHARIENGLPLTVIARGDKGQMVQKEVEYDPADLPDVGKNIKDRDVSAEAAEEWGSEPYDGFDIDDDPRESLESGELPPPPSQEQPDGQEQAETENTELASEPDSQGSGEAEDSAGGQKSDGDEGKATGKKSRPAGQGRKRSRSRPRR